MEEVKREIADYDKQIQDLQMSLSDIPPTDESRRQAFKLHVRKLKNNSYCKIGNLNLY